MDTREAYQTLREKGRFDEPVAKALVDAMTGLVSPPLGDLATKTELRAEIQGVKVELIRWLFGAVIAIVSATGVMLRLMH